METAQTAPEVQVIIPARDEQESIGRCLESLVRQKGIGFAITVVDDGSSDQTRTVVQSFPGVRVISAAEPPPGVSGKCNALIQGVEDATAKWLLFTDADTFHYPGSLAAAVGEAEERGVDLLSYSPEQETASWGERALMPVVFADLVRVYPPARVNDPSDPTVAANGQYVLVRRGPYESLGGHRAVADKILEDVELARLFKASNHKIWFRQGTGLVRTRMYRDFRSMGEGWTKNLDLLFARPLRLAVLRALEFVTILVSGATAIFLMIRGHHPAAAGALAVGAMLYALFLGRIRRAHFPAAANLMSFFGLPLFVWLLIRSWRQSRVHGAVTWKGRTYVVSAPGRAARSSIGEGSKVES